MPSWPPVGYPYTDGQDIIVAEIVHDLVSKFDAVGTAYDVAVENGFVGTEQQWLDSLEGEAGATGAAGTGVYVLGAADPVPSGLEVGTIILREEA